MKKTVLAIVLSIFAGVVACTCQPELGEARESHPYVATPERAARILGNYRKVKTGMSVEQVGAVLGEADEIRRLYEPRIKHDRQIGVTHWYLIQRGRDPLGVGQQDEKLVRVSYDLQGRVTVVDHWGFGDVPEER